MSVSSDVPVSLHCKSSVTCAGSAMSPASLAARADTAAETQGEAANATTKGREGVAQCSAGDTFVVVAYNINSFMDFQNRYEALMQELANFHWDVIVFTETWRADPQEIFTTFHEHTWFGSGGGNRNNGVGMLLHARWAYSAFNPISQRVATLDLDVFGTPYRIFGAYMPHTGLQDVEVEAAYAMLEAGLDEARGANKSCILAGDFNAEVGPRGADDDPRIIGPNVSGRSRNARGRWLVRWCQVQGLMLGNTFGGSGPDSVWTFEKGGLKTQLDYIIFDYSLLQKLVACEPYHSIDTGSAHRPVKATFSLTHSKRARKKEWPLRWGRNVNVHAYRASVGERTRTLDLSQGTASDKATALEGCMRDSMKKTRDKAAKHFVKSPFEADIQACIQERRDLQHDTFRSSQEKKQKKIELSKTIKKLVIRQTEWKKEVKINKAITEFRSLRHIAESHLPGGKSHIAQVVDAEGTLICSKAGIAEVFATFYESLYSSPPLAVASCAGECASPSFTQYELDVALRHLKSGRSHDGAGIAAEMLKHGGDSLLDKVLKLFNEVAAPDGEVPETWKHTRLVVLFKKGDPKLPKNYRPIAILPVLYKLFSRMLCNRIQSTIFDFQSPDQAAYRPGFSTADHLLSLTLLLESAREWQQDLWLGLVDFEKAFDKVDHTALWKALDVAGVDGAYAHMLRKLYAGQMASVSAGVKSRQFSLQQGVKQGDPISGLLFIAVMEQCFRTLKEKWNTLNAKRRGQYYGVVVDDPQDPLLNLRFADDVLLFSQSRADIVKMLCHLRAEASKYGLTLNLSKTKIMTTSMHNSIRSVDVGGDEVEILSHSDAERYLGKKVCVNNLHTAELSNRISAAWYAFSKFKPALCSRKLGFAAKMKLFEAVVTPVALYGCATWTVTVTMGTALKTVWRRMLRMMMGTRRDTNEDWVEYAQRATHIAEEQATKLRLKDWATQQRYQKWRFAGQVARNTSNKWNTRLLQWLPFFRCNPQRKVGHPYGRWGDCIVQVVGGDWPEAAKDVALWAELEDGFCNLF